MSPEIVIFDIDGTISDDRWRRKFLLEKPRQYVNYHMNCDKDMPNEEMMKIYSLIKQKHFIVIMTGRPIDYLGKTKQWLNFWGFKEYHGIHMRPKGDATPAAELKKQWLLKYLKDGYKVTRAYDDDDRNLAMFAEQGVNEAIKVIIK